MQTLLWEWEFCHVGLKASRCACCLLVNGSSHPVELRDGAATLVKGRGSTTLGSTGLGFNRATRRIAGGGGGVLVVLWGHSWSLINDGHATVTIETSAFTATVATKKAKIDFVVSNVNTAPSGSKTAERTFESVRLLEESVARNGMWSKYVIFVGDPEETKKS